MIKKYFNDKTSIPSEDQLLEIMGSRWGRYQQIVKELAKRNLKPQMYWYGTHGGWAARFCVEKMTVCGISLIQNPLVGLIGIGERMGYHMERDRDLSLNARVLYELAIPKGRHRWIEITMIDRGDLLNLLALVDGKLRAFALARSKNYKNLLAPEVYKDEKMLMTHYVKNYELKITENTKKVQIGPPSHYTLEMIMAAGMG